MQTWWPAVSPVTAPIDSLLNFNICTLRSFDRVSIMIFYIFIVEFSFNKTDIVFLVPRHLPYYNFQRQADVPALLN